MKALVSLLTDFGLSDRPFAAEMKAVIFSICPDATVVDISHTVEKFNIRTIITNISLHHPRRTNLNRRVTLKTKRRHFPVHSVNTCSELSGKESGFLVGGQGFLEIACREAPLESLTQELPMLSTLRPPGS